MRYLPYLSLLGFTGLAQSACPYMSEDYGALRGRDGHGSDPTESFLSQFYADNATDGYMTSDVGGPIGEQYSLKNGKRGPTLLEDFIFRQKIQHFDHERVPERAVHARGAGAHGVFTSYGNWSNITDASFLSSANKETPVFIRFSLVAGSRGCSDTARDVHGFATRFYTDEGNFDIVGNNIPVFFIQDAIQFPDLIHAVKPRPDNEIPQGATAHDTAWDFFSQQPSSLHTLFWAMAGHGIPRSFRHVDGFGVHTFRFVKGDGTSKYVKFHIKTLQGVAGMLWEEAQVAGGKNPDYHRQDLFDAIENGRYPEWEFGVQVFDESDVDKFNFDILDPTKIIPEEIIPITPLGKIQLNRNPVNYFAETEQIMFQPGHIVRGIDFTDDPLLQGRLFSYLDTQLNRHGGPNFEQLPINRPRVPFNNNNRDGAGQMFIPLNKAAYYPNTISNNYPKQATQSDGRGFFTAPRSASGTLLRSQSDTFTDVWSQPRLFWNSLLPAEQQMLVNAIRFENSKVESSVVKNNVLIQLNRVSHDLAARVADALGLPAPAADDKYYHNNKTSGVGTFGVPLKKLDGLQIGILAGLEKNDISTAKQLKDAITSANPGVDVTIVSATLADSNVGMTYAAADATTFDGVVSTEGFVELAAKTKKTTLFPLDRPLQILLEAYNYGKAVGFFFDREALAKTAKAGHHSLDTDLAAGFAAAVRDVKDGEGIVNGNGTNGEADRFAKTFLDELKKFKFMDRFPVDGS